MTDLKGAAYERDEPIYRNSTCDNCGTELVLHDLLYPTNAPIWFDEWTCPECLDGVYLDYPDGLPPEVPSDIEIESMDTATVEEVKEAFLNE